jgi:BMFP domain-containing protein YqiC
MEESTGNGATYDAGGARPHRAGAVMRSFASRKGNARCGRHGLVRFKRLVSSGRALYIAFPESLERFKVDPRFIDDLAKRLAAAVPPGLVALRRDLEDNFKAVLQSALARLDLVSRQEFDVQAAVLRRTREKLEALEARLESLERRESAHGEGSNASQLPDGEKPH